MVALQAECQVVQKDEQNPHFKSKFATILSMKGTVQPLLAKHGLAVLQFPIGNGSGTETGCRTIIVHTSGESIEGDFLIPIGDRIDAQKACAAVSYARRFALSGALGLVTAEDVDQDGNDLAANGGSSSQPKPAAKGKNAGPGPTLTEGQVKEFVALAEKVAEEQGCKGSELAAPILKGMGYAKSKEVHQSKFDDLIEKMSKAEAF